MAGETELIDADGETLLDENGVTAIHDDCCCDTNAAWRLTPCVEMGDDCEFCAEGTTSRFWTFLLGGVDASACACINLSGSASIQVTNITVDGYHVLEQSCVLCAWFKTNAGTVTFNAYDQDDCEGNATEYVVDLHIMLVRAEAGWTLTVYGSTGPWSNIRVFRGTFAEIEDDDCTTITSMSNLLSCGFDLGVRLDLADGGVALAFNPGDVFGGGLCPGGPAYYTDSSLGAYEGNVVHIAEDPGICYHVEANPDEHPAIGVATVTACWLLCEECCNEEAENCT